MKKNDIGFIIGGIFFLTLAIVSLAKGVVNDVVSIIGLIIFFALGIGYIFAGFIK